MSLQLLLPFLVFQDTSQDLPTGALRDLRNEFNATLQPLVPRLVPGDAAGEWVTRLREEFPTISLIVHELFHRDFGSSLYREGVWPRAAHETPWCCVLLLVLS
ncbi:hypothetical protein EDB80DRAFT_714934 [Ilyonectria destructans]|nr:hypothetical protein EDB80DRAFT_714934 [Ilyonectria destructans]